MKTKFKPLSLLTLLVGLFFASTARDWAGPPGFFEQLANENAVRSAINNANAKSQAPSPPPPPRPSTPPG